MFSKKPLKFEIAFLKDYSKLDIFTCRLIRNEICQNVTVFIASPPKNHHPFDGRESMERKTFQFGFLLILQEEEGESKKLGRAFLPSWPSGPEAELSPYSIRRVSRFISAAESGRKKSPCQPSPHKAASRGTRCRGALVRYLSAIHFTDDIASCQILL